jgi:stearoyl-CoA desaturase (delta-9 desaturase)
MSAIIATLVMVQITIACVTLYLHRGQAHRAVTFHPALEHFMRFWLWMTTGMLTKEWVAVHRKHHQACEKADDPHSPYVYGIWRVLFGGAWLYVKAKKNTDMVRQYGVGTPDDWIERNVYSRYPQLGIWLMLAIDVAVFGWWGFLIWGVQMIWVPFHAAGVINGLGHWWGYRNTNTKDRSKNIIPWAFWIGGEELHNGHHANPASPKLSQKWWEFDIGWMYIQILRVMGLAKLRPQN